MIRDLDRSGWFGASDTAIIMGSWETETFRRWWLTKLGLCTARFTSIAMRTGTVLEHRILDELGISRRDRQIRITALRLRVNLDGETRQEITEVKTHRSEAFRVSRAYWMQCQVEMFAARKRCRIAAYRVTDEDYQNYFLPIEWGRLSFHPVGRDDGWIEGQYLPRLRRLRDCLVEGRWPV